MSFNAYQVSASVRATSAQMALQPSPGNVAVFKEPQGAAVRIYGQSQRHTANVNLRLTNEQVHKLIAELRAALV